MMTSQDDSLLNAQLKALHSFEITNASALEEFRQKIILPTRSPVSVKSIMLKGLTSARRLEIDSIETLFAYYVGMDAYFHLGDIDSVVHYANMALDAARRVPGYERWQGFALLLRANAEQAKEDFSGGLQTNYEIIDLYKTMEDSSNLTYPYAQISELYAEVGDLENAIKYSYKCLEAVRYKSFPDSIYNAVYAYDRLSIYYSLQNEEDSSNLYLQKALADVEKIDTISSNLSFQLVSFAIFENAVYHHLDNDNIEIAYYYLQKAQSRTSSVPRSQFLMDCLNFAYAVEIEDYKSAGQIQNDPTFSENRAPFHVEKRRIRNQLRYFEGIDEPEKAVQVALELIDFLNDQHSKVNSQVIALANAELEVKEKESEIQLLNQTQGYQQQLRKGLLGIIILISALLLVSLYAYRQTQNRNSLLHQDLEKKRVMEAQTIRLRKLDQLKSKFFRNISHELGTPLSLILGPVNTVLKAGLITQSDKKLLAIAKQNVDHLLKLTNEILDLSKSEVDDLKIHLETRDLGGFIGAISDNYLKMAESQQQKFVYPELEHLDIKVKTDFVKLESILTNLLNNAFRNIPSQGEVRLDFNHGVNQIFFNVRDNGSGISNEEQAKIFDLYYQSESEQSVPSGGAGIGLAICREYTRLLGGDIQVLSNIGEGSLFTLILPRLPIDQASSVDDNNATSRITQAIGKVEDAYADHVLILEDNLEMCTYLETILEKDYALTVVHNGQQGLDALGRFTPSLIITDLLMPVMDGRKFIERIKEDDKWSDIPILVLTARSGVWEKGSALDFGVDDYLEKPFEETELKLHLDNLLSFAEGRREIKDVKIAVKKGDRLWLRQLNEVLLNSISSFDLNLQVIADELELSTSSLNTKVKSFTGLSPMQYVNEVRFQEARKLLLEKKISSVKAVSYTVGFRSEKNFSRNFKKRFGKYPSEYLKG